MLLGSYAPLLAFIASAALNLLAVDAVDSVMLHVLLNGFGWGALYETTNDFTSAGVAPRGRRAPEAGGEGNGVESRNEGEEERKTNNPRTADGGNRAWRRDADAVDARGRDRGASGARGRT